jgi:hypothetical protein
MMVNGSTDFSYEADPGPFIVGEDEPQRPTILFRSDKQAITAGRWIGTVTALRDQGLDPLVEQFCVEVTDEDMADYWPVGNHQHINFRNDRPDSVTDCYWRPD